MPNAHSRRVHRGDIVRVDFDPIEGSEQGGVRPALVISPEIINRGEVIVVASITSKNTDRVFPWECLLEAGEANLPARSKALFRHIRGISTARILGYYGSVSAGVLERIEEPLQIAVGLEKL